MDALQDLSRSRGLPLVEDVAQAFGGRWRGHRLGSLGRVGAFSFFPSKNLGGLGDGGLVATDDDAVADTVRMLRAHGTRRKYENERIGRNSRLDALQAAFLRAKLPHVDTWNAARRQAAGRYRALLSGIPGLTLPAEGAGTEHVFHQFTVRIAGGRRDAAAAALAARGVNTMIYYPKCLHELPVYSAGAGRFPEAERARAEVLSLPMWPRIDAGTQERVAAALRDTLSGADR
jgi:dTDP-4-amino-4,6-dideoxygalactose transaminase